MEIYGSFQFPSNFNRSRPAANFANNESRMAHTASAQRGNVKRDAVGVREMGRERARYSVLIEMKFV